MKNLLILCFVITGKISVSQSLTPSVVGSAGDFYTKSVGSLAWTLGEIMVETYQKSQGYFTQGFQQPNTLIVTELAHIEKGISYFPNPVLKSLTLKIEQSGSYTIELFDLRGIKLVSTLVQINESKKDWELDMQNFAAALYLLRITEETSGSTYSYRVEKI